MLFQEPVQKLMSDKENAIECYLIILQTKQYPLDTGDIKYVKCPEDFLNILRASHVSSVYVLCSGSKHVKISALEYLHG